MKTSSREQSTLSRNSAMTRGERLDEALRTMDFYELAKLTYEGENNEQGNGANN